MISRSCRHWIGFACLAVGVSGPGVRADDPPAASFEHVPQVALPITVPRRVPRVVPNVSGVDKVVTVAAETTPPDPLRGTPAIKPETTGADAMQVLARLLPGRSDTPYDWHAPVEPLHQPCEPRALPPCVPPPPCHPSEPPQPYDLVGVPGCPSGGPIYRGPCEPRTGTPHHGMFAWYHRLHDRFVDHFYRWK